MQQHLHQRGLFLPTLVTFLCIAAQPTLADQCPATPDGTVITLPSLDPPPRPGEPEMSVPGVATFVQQNRVGKVADLLKALPAQYQKNYAFIERTRGQGKSSLQFPRIVLFGSDARLLMNISTDPSDPSYERLDMASMNKTNGNWEFAQLNFATSPPTLRSNPAECTQCHGNPARPIWGSYLNWPGAFDDNPAPGDQAEGLTAAHAQRLNSMNSKQGKAIHSDSTRSNGAAVTRQDSHSFCLTTCMDTP